MTATSHGDFIAGAAGLAIDDDIGPHPVDRHVGLHIRMRRKALGISQERLAESLGLTFQQVQKYERGANRASASKLWEIARALRTNVAYFYEGLESQTDETTRGFMGANAQEFLLTPEGMELAATFPRVRRPGVRRKVLDLVRAMADMEIEDHAPELSGVK